MLFGGSQDQQSDEVQRDERLPDIQVALGPNRATPGGLGDAILDQARERGLSTDEGRAWFLHWRLGSGENRPLTDELWERVLSNLSDETRISDSRQNIDDDFYAEGFDFNDDPILGEVLGDAFAYF